MLVKFKGKNGIYAKMIEFSKSDNEKAPVLITFELCYPRFILAELNTHRVFERSTASNRAIPFKKLVANMEDKPAVPVKWGINRPGMIATENLKSDKDVDTASVLWHLSAQDAINSAVKLSELGLHKQITNRVIEPFMMVKTILTGTDFINFFQLRLDKAAQPEIRELAWCMRECLDKSIPSEPRNKWHLPYVTLSERQTYNTDQLCQISSARCARVSYLNHDGGMDVSKDLELARTLLKMGHMSPLGHQARIPNDDSFENEIGYTHVTRFNEFYSGCLKYWVQYRHLV
jgi:thymidylate synthase ThyX